MVIGISMNEPHNVPGSISLFTKAKNKPMIETHYPFTYLHCRVKITEVQKVR